MQSVPITTNAVSSDTAHARYNRFNIVWSSTGTRRCVNMNITFSNGQKIVSNIYNNNKASNAKISQNVNKAVYFFACFFRVNLVVCFDSILPEYTSALLFLEINPSSERRRELFVGCWSLMTSMGGNSHCNCSGLNPPFDDVPN
jgi:hypothetical protein